MTTDGKHIGISITGSTDAFWVLKCPCGSVVTYPINGLPDKDVRFPFPCRNNNHWAIKYETGNVD